MSNHTHHQLLGVWPSIEKVVYKVLGTADGTAVLSSIESNLCNGFDSRKLGEELSFIVDERRAMRICDKIEDLVCNFRIKEQQSSLPNAYDSGTTQEGKKRPLDHAAYNPPQPVRAKRFMHEKDITAIATNTCNTEETTIKNETDILAGNNFSAIHIKQMMENAQREIEERKRKLENIKLNKHSNIPATAVAAALTVNAKLSTASAKTIDDDSKTSTNVQTDSKQVAGPSVISDIERSKKIAKLQEQIRAKLSGTLANVLPQQHPPVDKPKPLILDAEGRTVDGSGRTIIVPQLTPTLKANIRAKKRETTRNLQASERTALDASYETQFHDDRIVLKPAVRIKRSLRFHEPGKFQQLAERLRMKAQLEKLQNEISQIARKTGISSATKLALIAPKSDIHMNDVPQMEWWDSVILMDDFNTIDAQGNISIRESSITNLIEHPTQMRPPNESSRGVYLPVFLTKKERRKLRRQNRREAWKEEQEKIRLGLEAPPEPKLRISNLMRVLGTEAVQDPTKIEAHVREQMVKRQKIHEEANAARKLTDDQRREKKNRKMKEDTTLGVSVAVYRIRELQEQQSKKFKVETNAKQLFLTGACVLFRDCCVVVVEGGPKQQKKYRRLMLHRIKWEEDLVKNADGKEISNSCVLVWEGMNQRRNFGEFKYKSFPLEKSARDFFQKHHVEHYWDLAYSGAVLEASEDV
ncbi:U4/U6 small nuclear ribonucleoprotein Prp3 isoform X1 [Anopheles moucheti]|uniref:U4/U6 small nuclear ribonucleoprotein Prp3 isoform X1 n=1 Tax=Anopheles moucheti TaxID=186751 RepID=UPI0022F10CF9|nr:U4/U6 small nuclear ribonucleoprotein Prp3 isoform X1 [Anopheles moucheti]